MKREKEKSALITVLVVLFVTICLAGLVGADDYQSVPWAKLFNPAFAKEFDGAKVQFEAQWLGVAQGMMHMTAGFKPYNSGDWVEIGVAPVEAKKTDSGQYEGQQWALYIQKENSDVAFELKEGDIVQVYAEGVMHKFGSVFARSNAMVNPLVLHVDKIEKKAGAVVIEPEKAPNESADIMAQLKKLKDMLDAGLITQEEYDAKKKELLEKM